MTITEADDHTIGQKTIPDKDALVEQLVAVMRRKGWSQAQTARAVTERLPPGETFNKANLNHYFNGRSRPGPKFRRVLTEVLEELERPPEEPSRRMKARRQRTGSSQEPVRDGPGLVQIEDQGDQVRLQIDTCVSWPVALKVLEALKGQSVS